MVLMSFVKGALLAILGRESLTVPNSLDENSLPAAVVFLLRGLLKAL